MSLADVPTSSELGDQLDRLAQAIEQMTIRLDEIEAQRAKRD